MHNKIGLFDMDGTLFDFEGQLRWDLSKLMSPGETLPDNLWDESQPWLKARMDLIKNQPGWWRNLPKHHLGWPVFRWATQIGFKAKILTKGPSGRPLAWAEKVQCIADHLGPEIPIDIVGENKDGQYGRFLCDDYVPYMEGWLKWRPRGLGILIGTDQNRGYEHPNVIRFGEYTESDQEEAETVYKALEAAFARENGQHWKDLL